MKRIMYVLQDGDKFYWKGDNSSQHDLREGFENAYLFKTIKGAESRRKLPCYSHCVIKEVELKLLKWIEFKNIAHTV